MPRFSKEGLNVTLVCVNSTTSDILTERPMQHSFGGKNLSWWPIKVMANSGPCTVDNHFSSITLDVHVRSHV